METTQINFRIPLDLLREIKEDSEKQGIKHTQWILDACRERLANNSKATQSGDDTTNPHNLDYDQFIAGVEELFEQKLNEFHDRFESILVKENKQQNAQCHDGMPVENVGNSPLLDEDGVAAAENVGSSPQPSSTYTLDTDEKCITLSSIARKHNKSPRTINKYLNKQVTQVGDIFEYKGCRYQAVHIPSVRGEAWSLKPLN